MVAALLVSASGCGPVTFVVGASSMDQRLEPTVVRKAAGRAEGRIALIDVSGLLVNAEKFALLEQGENPVSLFHEQLAAAAADPKVKAVVLRINSPGGGVTASDMMYRDVRRFREGTGKPVVALLMDVAASGGYYVACGADEIVAYPTSLTGSIGVIVQTVSFKPALERWGVRAEAITSGPNKDAGSPLSTLTDEHRAILRGIVDEFHAGFVAVVREGRPGVAEADFARITDGRVVTGAEAAEVGLADRMGDLHDAIAVAKSRAGIRAADVVRYHRPLRYVGSPYARLATGRDAPDSINLLQLNIDALGGIDAPVGAFYLWRPDLP